MNATATRPARQPRKPQPRSLRLLCPPMETGKNGILRITAGKLVQTYFLDRVPSDWGEGFALEKARDAATEARTVYHVHLTDEGHTCDCLGFLRWEHCKHADGVAVLKSRNAI
jgi:hypothetical protein